MQRANEIAEVVRVGDRVGYRRDKGRGRSCCLILAVAQLSVYGEVRRAIMGGSWSPLQIRDLRSDSREGRVYEVLEVVLFLPENGRLSCYHLPRQLYSSIKVRYS
jgi:hypothetical protein